MSEIVLGRGGGRVGAESDELGKGEAKVGDDDDGGGAGESKTRHVDEPKARAIEVISVYSKWQCLVGGDRGGLSMLDRRRSR